MECVVLELLDERSAAVGLLVKDDQNQS